MEGPDPYSPCTCGSGKKYKFCCRAKGTAIGTAVELALARRSSEDVSDTRARAADDRWFSSPFALCAVRSDWRRVGVTPFVFARRVGDTLFAHLFLVDVFGLGLKDCYPVQPVREADFLRMVFTRSFPAGHVSWSEAQGRAFVWQAAEFARLNGFVPPRGWRECAHATGAEPDDLRVDPALFSGGRRGVHVIGEWEDIRSRLACPMDLTEAIADWERRGFDFTLGPQHMPLP